jgi:hypothetical protein
MALIPCSLPLIIGKTRTRRKKLSGYVYIHICITYYTCVLPIHMYYIHICMHTHMYNLYTYITYTYVLHIIHVYYLYTYITYTYITYKHILHAHTYYIHNIKPIHMYYIQTCITYTYVLPSDMYYTLIRYKITCQLGALMKWEINMSKKLLQDVSTIPSWIWRKLFLLDTDFFPISIGFK